MSRDCKSLLSLAFLAHWGYNTEKERKDLPMKQLYSVIRENTVLNRIFFAVILLCAGILVIRVILTILRRALQKSNLANGAHRLISSLASVALYVLLGLIVASSLGIDVTGIVALASVLTLSVSLALQNMLANVIGGFTLLSTHPFRAGDFVEIAGQSGTVQEINMSYTTLLTPDNKQISIPNSAVVAGDIVNYSSTGVRRVDVAIRVSYGESSQKVIDALVQAGTMDRVLLDPAPAAVIDDYQPDGIGYSLRVWTKTEDYWDVLYAVNQNIRSIFEAQGIKIAYPHVHVYMEK